MWPSAVRNVGSDHVIRKLSVVQRALEPQRRLARARTSSSRTRRRRPRPRARSTASGSTRPSREAGAPPRTERADGAGGHSTPGTALDVRSTTGTTADHVLKFAICFRCVRRIRCAIFSVAAAAFVGVGACRRAGAATGRSIAFASSSGGMKFSRYGEPFLHEVEQHLLLRQRDQLRVEAVVGREGAGRLEPRGHPLRRVHEHDEVGATPRGTSSTR